MIADRRNDGFESVTSQLSGLALGGHGQAAEQSSIMEMVQFADYSQSKVSSQEKTVQEPRPEPCVSTGMARQVEVAGRLQSGCESHKAGRQPGLGDRFCEPPVKEWALLL